MHRLAPLIVLVVACRSVDPGLEGRIRRELEHGSGAVARSEPAPAPGAPVPVPWNKGQYALWSVRDGEHTSLVKAEIEQADADGAVVAITTLSLKLRTTAQLTFTQQPHTREQARQYLTQVIRRRADDRPLTYRFHRDVPADMRDAFEPLWGTLVPQPVEGASLQTATTAVLRAEGCMLSEGVFIDAPIGLSVRALLHPAVPITGVVAASAPGGQTVQLIALGWSGGGPEL